MNLKEYCSFLRKIGINDPRHLLATKLNVSRATIDSYICGRRLIPLQQCLNLEKETNRLVQCEDLRPDFDWGFFRGHCYQKEIDLESLINREIAV